MIVMNADYAYHVVRFYSTAMYRWVLGPFKEEVKEARHRAENVKASPL